MLSKKSVRIIAGLVMVGAIVLLSLWRVVYSSYAAEAETRRRVYLPLVSRNFPPPPTVFGAEALTFTDPALIQLAVDARISWLRIPAFNWSEIEPTAPVDGVHTYDWNQVPESSLQNIADNHMYAIATVKMTPLWAQKYPGEYCGPIAESYLDDFAEFLSAAVQRYSQPPYNVHYWELGNEPDVDPDLLPDPYSVFGCWGDDDDEYYGGGYYAEMLKVAYPAIKAADPDAQVLIGGLLLDCDPGDPDCRNPKLPRFFEGILRNGGGAYFDIVGFHGYSHYWDGVPIDENWPSWDQRGGVVLGKSNFLREVMTQYGIDKPLFHTEGAVLCAENNPECNPPGDAYENVKAEYVIWLYARALANDFESSIWYTLDGRGWRHGGLIGDTSDPNPAYDALRFMTQELAGADFLRQPEVENENLRAYEFSVPDKKVWVVWSADGVAHHLNLPAGYTQVLDMFGNLITPSDDSLGVKSPVYIELP